MIHNAEVGGEPRHDYQKMARLVLPILTAQARGHFRWCSHCLQLTPDQIQVGYCQAGDRVLKYQDVGKAALPAQKPCHKAHLESGSQDRMRAVRG